MIRDYKIITKCLNEKISLAIIDTGIPTDIFELPNTDLIQSLFESAEEC
jgi:hypothetical protein